jgi:hypothetical protein
MNDTYTEYKLRMSIAGVAPISEVDWNAWQAKHKQPAPVMVKCNCGHTVSKILVMSTSNGSSCPDCYDRMEN